MENLRARPHNGEVDTPTPVSLYPPGFWQTSHPLFTCLIQFVLLIALSSFLTTKHSYILKTFHLSLIPMTFGCPYVVAIPLRAEVPNSVQHVISSLRDFTRSILRSCNSLLPKQTMGSYQLLNQDEEVQMRTSQDLSPLGSHLGH